MERAGAIKVQKALKAALAAMEETGFDTYNIREILANVENRLTYPRGERPISTALAPPSAIAPADRQRVRNQIVATAARNSAKEQEAFDRASRILSAAVGHLIADFRKRYDYYETRFALHGALNRIAGSVTEMIAAHDRAVAQEEFDARSAFTETASRRFTGDIPETGS